MPGVLKSVTVLLTGLVLGGAIVFYEPDLTRDRRVPAYPAVQGPVEDPTNYVRVPVDRLPYLNAEVMVGEPKTDPLTGTTTADVLFKDGRKGTATIRFDE